MTTSNLVAFLASRQPQMRHEPPGNLQEGRPSFHGFVSYRGFEQRTCEVIVKRVQAGPDRASQPERLRPVVCDDVPSLQPGPERQPDHRQRARVAGVSPVDGHQKGNRKRPKRRLPRKAHQLLANSVATFCETLRNEAALQALIRSSPRNFRADLLGLIRAQFPLRRGRPPDPQLDKAYRMVAEGKSVPQVARKQFSDWSRKDPYERYLILKGLGQAVRRRRPRPYKNTTVKESRKAPPDWRAANRA